MRKNAFFLTLQFLFDLVLLTAFFLPDFTFSLSFQRLIFLIFLSGCFHLSIPLTLLLSPDIIHCLEHQLDSLSLSLSLYVALWLSCHISSHLILWVCWSLDLWNSIRGEGEVWGEGSSKSPENDLSKLLSLARSTDKSALGNQMYCHFILSLSSRVFLQRKPPYSHAIGLVAGTAGARNQW